MNDIRAVVRKGVGRVDLGSTLDMRVPDRLKQALEHALAKAERITIDAGSVERLSTACIQVLIAGTAAMTRAGIPFTVRHPSEVFVSSFRDLGLDTVLSDWKIET